MNPVGDDLVLFDAGYGIGSELLQLRPELLLEQITLPSAPYPVNTQLGIDDLNFCDIGATSLESLEAVVFASFFTLAGVGLELGHLVEVGVLALAVSIARIGGKLVAAEIGMRFAGVPRNVRRYPNLAIPHGILPEGQSMVGVLGLSADGLAFDTPDGKPVHCIVLLATPESQRDRHLQVIAGLARLGDRDPALRDALFGAASPAHAHDVLHAESAESFNYYLTE